MSNVTITIAGRQYTVACAEGEQGHITGLSQTIDSKLASIPGLSNQSEPRTLLFAALLLADELHETAAAAAAQAQISLDDLATPLENIAQTLEDVASRLETAATSA